MIERKLRIRINSKLKSDSKQFAMILQDETKDPHAHDAWKKVKTDLIERLGFEYVGTQGMLAFGEFTDTFKCETGEIYLSLETDSGDLMLSTSDELIFSSVISRLGSLANYETEQ